MSLAIGQKKSPGWSDRYPASSGDFRWRERPFLLWLLGFGILFPVWVESQTVVWSFGEIVIPRENPAVIDLTVQVRSESDPCRLGNHNLRLDFSQSLFGMDSPHPPHLVSVFLDSFRMALSHPPCGDLQLNAVFDGHPESGPRIDGKGLPVARIRFTIRDTTGTSGFRFRMINQTFASDRTTRLEPRYEDARGDVPLRIPMGPDTADTTVSAMPLDAKEGLPTAFSLSSNFPNPFNPETRIRYALPIPSHVQLTIFNLQGQPVRVFDFGRQFAGYHEVIWEGKDASGVPVPAGIYLLRFRAGPFEARRKLILAK